MPEVVEQQQEVTFDPAAHIEQRNKVLQAQKDGKPAPEAPKPEAKAAEPVKKEAEQEPARLPRSARREINQLREAKARAEGELEAYRKMGVKQPEPEVKVSDDPEPNPSNFATDAEYNRALGKWEARQETKKVIGAEKEQANTAKNRADLAAHALEMDAKCAVDSKNIPDLEEVMNANQSDPDALQIIYDKQTGKGPDALLYGLIAHSDVRAYMLYHFAKNPEVFQKVIDLRDDQDGQIALFKRLEGRVETMYSSTSKKEAAQASDKPKDESKDRTHPAEADKPAGRNSDKPRPSTEVAARGGSAPPEEPEIGSAAWMAKRNQATGGR